MPVREQRWLGSPERVESERAAAMVLPRGGAIDLPHAHRWTVAASWVQHASCEVDVVAFALDDDGQVSCDEDFVFYGAAESPDGTVRLAADGPTEQAVAVDLSALPQPVRKVTIAAAIDGERVIVQATLDAGTTERTMLLADIYRRGPRWRLRVVGQGHDFGLDELARGLGVGVDAEE